MAAPMRQTIEQVMIFLEMRSFAVIAFPRPAQAAARCQIVATGMQRLILIKDYVELRSQNLI
jgi:hypothetical protein